MAEVDHVDHTVFVEIQNSKRRLVVLSSLLVVREYFERFKELLHRDLDLVVAVCEVQVNQFAKVRTVRPCDSVPILYEVSFKQVRNAVNFRVSDHVIRVAPESLVSQFEPLVHEIGHRSTVVHHFVVGLAFGKEWRLKLTRHDRHGSLGLVGEWLPG